jgi:hypothetical protein
MNTSRYTFIRNFASRHGELRRDHRGFVKVVAKAYLNTEGWLMFGNGGWMTPGSFRVLRGPLAAQRVSLPLVRLLSEALDEARRLLDVQRLRAVPLVVDTERNLSAERDNRVSA